MRALVASVGASAALVAGAAVALLFVSLLVGYDGFTGYLDGSTQQAAIRVTAADAGSSSGAGKRSHAAAPIIVAAPRPRAPAAVKQPLVRHRPMQSVRTGGGAALTLTPATTASGEAVATPPTPPTPPKTAPKPTVGDGVRQLGNDVSSTVQHTGDATGAVTKVLGPPVSAAVQKVLDLISSLLKKTTGALGSTVDAILPQHG